MHKELIIYCDESSSRGTHFSDFYGGALVGSDDVDAVRSILAEKKRSLNFLGEVKWTKITENYEQKYIALMDTFFDLIGNGHVKVRIMFTQNMYAAVGLKKEHTDNKYFVLYYQFIKHAFGFVHANSDGTPIGFVSIWTKCLIRRKKLTISGNISQYYQHRGV